MLYTFIGMLIGIVFICLIPKFMEWTDYSSTDWKNKINNHDTRDLKIEIMKKINPNDEVNAKILQILDECENDIAAVNKALEELYNEQQEESWDYDWMIV